MKKVLLQLIFLLALDLSGRAQSVMVAVDSHTNLYILAGGVTNLVTSLVVVPTNMVASECADYTNTTWGTSSNLAIDVSRPTQYELGYTLGCALRETRRSLANFIAQSFYYDGTLQSNVVGNGSLQATCVDTNNLTTNVTGRLLPIGGLQLSSNLYTYVWGQETPGPAMTFGTSLTNIFSYTVSSNSFRNMIFEYALQYHNGTGNDRSINEIKTTLGGVTLTDYSGTFYRLIGDYILPFSIHSQGTTITGSPTVTIQVSGELAANANITIQLLYFRVIGIP